MIDRVTRPLRSVGAGLRGFARQSENAFKPLAKGAIALWGVKKAVQGALDPAIQMFNALKKASARGIGEDALQKLSKDALLFSSRYGTSAQSFVESSLLIKSSISGLSDRELPRMTKAANLLSAATGESAETIAGYYGAMYNQFRSTANKMGRVKFMENLTDQSAYMVRNFGLSMAQIQDLMKGSKGAGVNLGVSLSDQFATLGQLSRTMGTEGAGAYEQFLNKAVEGGKALGVSLTDANGKLLAMPDIIQKLQNKYGKSIQGNLKAQAELDKAFGGGSAVIKALYGNVDEMRKHMDALGSNTGMKNATDMAKKMADPISRCTSVLFALRAAIGAGLVPVLYPLVDKLADSGEQFTRWMKIFPNIARWIGYISVGFLSFAAAGAMANIVMGITRFIMIGLKGIMVAFGAILKIGRVFILAYRAAVIAWNVALRILRGTLLAIRIAAVLAGVSFAVMSWPILLIIAAIALLCAGVYLLVKYWDDIKAAVMDTTAFKLVALYWETWKKIFFYVVGAISQAWEDLCNWFAEISPFDSFADMADSLGNVFSNLWAFLKKSFSETYNWIVDKLNYIPGINIDLMPSAPAAPAATALTGTNLKGGNQGGISQAIKTNTTNQIDNSRRVGSVTINQQQPMTPAQLNEWIEMNAG